MSHLFPTLTPDLVRKHIQAARKAENPVKAQIRSKSNSVLYPPKLGLAPNVYPSYRVPFKDLRPVHPHGGCVEHSALRMARNGQNYRLGSCTGCSPGVPVAGIVNSGTRRPIVPSLCTRSRF